MPFECMKVSLLIIDRNNVRCRYGGGVVKPTPAAVSKKETEVCVFENLICEVKTAVYIK